MRIAAAYENGTISLHFGHAEQLMLYDVEGGKIVKTQVIDTSGPGHSAQYQKLLTKNHGFQMAML